MGIFHPKKQKFWYFLVNDIDIDNDTVSYKSMSFEKKLQNQ